MSESKLNRIVIVIRERSKDRDDGYIPCGVEEGALGWSPMSGNGECASPWNWGPDKEVAQRIANEYNEKLGLTEKEVQEIVAQWDPLGDKDETNN